MGREAGSVLGDRAYDGKPCRDQIAAIGAEAVVPPHPCRKDPAAFDRHLYKARHAIENLFAKLKLGDVKQLSPLTSVITPHRQRAAA